MRLEIFNSSIRIKDIESDHLSASPHRHDPIPLYPQSFERIYNRSANMNQEIIGTPQDGVLIYGAIR